VALFNSKHAISYYLFIVTMSLSCTVSDIALVGL